MKPPARKGNRADVMFLVNGVPVCIVEHKNPKDGDAIERGITQLRRYEKETPELIGAPQLFNVTHLLDYWYGVTWNATRRYMARWKQTPDEAYRFAVQAFFERTDFLRTLQHWILFYVKTARPRNPCCGSISAERSTRSSSVVPIGEAARAHMAHARIGQDLHSAHGGRLILEEKARFHNATVILVVDRTELEGQLKGWVERLLGEMQELDIATERANSKAKLQSLLDADFRGLIVSMIHKFEAIRKNSCMRDNVFVFIDEAHRSVAKDLGTYLMAAVPNATIIGFTGTPIAKTAQGEGTFKIFGADDERGYLDKYSIAESIEDETTIPIKHMLAPSTMTVPAEQLDKEFFELAGAEGVTDVEELNKVLDRAVGLRTFLTADDRSRKVAEFVAEHFKENVVPLGYKAFLVAVNREACAKYKQALDKLLPPEWTEAVYTENAADTIDRPLVAELQLSEEREKDVRQLFKKADREPEDFDRHGQAADGLRRSTPLLHVPGQADARPCPAPGRGARKLTLRGWRWRSKRVGLVVDFVGVLRELKKALQFDSSDVSGVIEDLDVSARGFQDEDRRRGERLSRRRRRR